MGAVALLIAIPLTIVLRSSDSPDGPLPAPVSVPQVGGPTTDRALGVSYQLPKGWSQNKKAGVIDLRSSDRATGVTISAPAKPDEVTPVLDDAVNTLRGASKSVAVLGRLGDEKLGGLQGKGELITLLNHSGARVRTLLLAVSGKQHTYLVQSFTAGYGSGAPLGEGQALLNSLKLTG